MMALYVEGFAARGHSDEAHDLATEGLRFCDTYGYGQRREVKDLGWLSSVLACGC
jgi:hypothetical protein